MRSAVLRRGKTLALCALLLSAALLYWFVSARSDTSAEVFASYVPAGNNFARFASDNVELLSRSGEVLVSEPFAYEDRALASCGDAAAAWSACGEVVFLGEGGARRASLPGELLGLFGSDCGSAAAICEIRGEAVVCLYGIYGEVLRIAPEAWPIAAEISPDGALLAVLGADGAGFSVEAYSLPAGRCRWQLRLDGPEYDLEWETARTLRVFGGAGLYIDGLTGAVE